MAVGDWRVDFDATPWGSCRSVSEQLADTLAEPCSVSCAPSHGPFSIAFRSLLWV